MKLPCVVSLLLCVCSIAAQTDPVSQVDPFIGTQLTDKVDGGNTIPGATLPFGMLYWSPDPPEGEFYSYPNLSTRGFSLTHLSGPGCGVYGDIPILPMLGLPSQPPSAYPLPYQAKFKHSDEVAQPGYYSVKLDSGIEIQLAAAQRSGIAVINYPSGTDPHTVLFDLSRNLARVQNADIRLNGSRVTGSVSGGGFCRLNNRYRIYFVAETEETPQASGTFNELGYKPDSRDGTGPRTGGYLRFASSTRTLHLKVGISFVSVANAEENLKKEIPDWNLDRVRNEARKAWNDALGHIMVTGGTDDQRKIFYTALYHSLLHPTVFNDENGDYIGFDDKVRKVTGRNQYANFSGWDIYRTQVQLITMLMPTVGSDLAQSLVTDAEQGGGLPIWPVANDETSCMVGDPSAIILANIYAFGGRNFDVESALKAMIRGAEDPATHSRLYPERPGLADYLAKGYIPQSNTIRNSASVTLEDEAADFSISRIALALGDHATSEKYLARSAGWTKLFDPEKKYLRARDKDRNFLPDFTTEKTIGFAEGNSAQYTWMIPYDLAGLISAIGGPKDTNDRLDDYFSRYSDWGVNNAPYFFIANEPSFGDPWIYDWTGKPWRAQEVVRKTLADLFMATPDGLPGNDDLGATSAWIVFAQLGLYPEIPGVGGFAISSPAFPKVTLKLGDHNVQIVAPDTTKKPYIQSISVDGKPVHNWWFDWETIKHSDKVEFTMASQPAKDTGDTPPSFGPGQSQSNQP
jgi:predicted alpha-1,2-mannosidase